MHPQSYAAVQCYDPCIIMGLLHPMLLGAQRYSSAKAATVGLGKPQCLLGGRHIPCLTPDKGPASAVGFLKSLPAKSQAQT